MSDDFLDGIMKKLRYEEDTNDSTCPPQIEDDDLMYVDDDFLDDMDVEKEYTKEDFIASYEPAPEDLTCFGCPSRDVCIYVDDWYNTDGDCLADK